VFKTSVKTKKDVKKLKPYLNELCKKEKWNFDLEDCDKILRIDSQREILQTVICLLQNIGFDCEELLY
jgi:hypothetical protein